MNRINLEDVLKIEEDDDRYSYFLDKSLELGKYICELKKIEYNEGDKEDEFYSMAREIYYESIAFEDFYYLHFRMNSWNSIPVERDPEPIVRIYNDLIEEIDEYNALKQRILEKGFKELKEELCIKLKDIFCKMLDYKKRKYDKDADIKDLISKLTLCYYDFSYVFDATYQMLASGGIYKDTERDDFWFIKADHVEYIRTLEFTYNFFKDDEAYQNYDQFYEDLELKEGQTLKDLFEEEQEKMRLLFKEMLEYINVPFKDDKYHTLEYLIFINFPYFRDILILIEGAHEYSYINHIHTLRKCYDALKKRYKNHEKELAAYEKKQSELNDAIMDEEWLDEQFIDNSDELNDN